jgi:hypothetical protein
MSMAKQERAVRTTITVPAGLKKRMDSEGESVNWSAVAARAFEAELTTLASKREGTTMKDVVARLKAAAELEENEDYQAGMEAGRDWAKRQAKPKELRRLAEYIRNWQGGCEWWDVGYPGWMAPFGAADNFVFTVRPSRESDRGAPAEFWEEALGEDAHRIEDDDFLHGFGDGAAEVWDQVAEEL